MLVILRPAGGGSHRDILRLSGGGGRLGLRRRREPGRPGERLRTMGLGAASKSEAQKPRRRSRRGRTALLVLVALASAGAACTYAARVWPFSATGTCQRLAAPGRARGAGHAPGQTVIISVTLANEGPACSTGTSVSATITISG